jgi:dihydrofolate synthase/folylpolyglutamate synthase
MDYQGAVRYLLSLGRELAAPTQAAAAKFDLENISVLAQRLGRPDRAYPSVHIAGTNGKGSTAAFLESILRESGFRTGLYTSPHLERINERIRIAGEEISDDAFATTFTRIRSLIEELLADGKLRAHPTFFECVTTLAFESFAQARVDFAVFEVGLGGRLDATNILRPSVSIITRIAFDHENFLGHSLKEIASEKAGILKSAIPAVVAPQDPEAMRAIHARAEEVGSPILETESCFCLEGIQADNLAARADAVEIATGERLRIAPRLLGQFQLQNALNAAAAACFLRSRGFRIRGESIERGIAAAEWPGRLERLGSSPDVYLDGAHNPAAARELAEFLRKNFAGRKIRILFGALRDKAVDEIAGILFSHAEEVVFTEAGTSRAISAQQLAEIAGHHANRFSVNPAAEEAFDDLLACAEPSDAVFVTGSLYLVGQIRHHWLHRAKVAAR